MLFRSFAGEWANTLVSVDPSVGSRFYKVLTALNGGKELDIDDELDTDELKGKKCRIVVTRDDDKEYPVQITAIKPLKKKVEDDDEEEKPKKKKVEDDDDEF